MPKYCSVPNCKNDSGHGNDNDRKRFYKFPLQEPDRLQQWLKNMGRDEWVPSRHQYICHQHFNASCFKVRWGIRYLENDAVPTVFQGPEKRKGEDPSERTPKRLRGNANLRIAMSDDGAVAADTIEPDSRINTVHLYEISVDPSQPGESVLLESSDDSLQLDMNQSAVDGLDTGADFPVTLYQAVDDLSFLDGESTEVVVMSECPAGEAQEGLVNGISAAILTQSHHGLMLNDCTACPTEEEVPTFLAVADVASASEEHRAQLIAHFETIPNILVNGSSAHIAAPSDTVLSSALGSKPITSTLPIVSKHVAASSSPSLVLTMERLDAEEADGDMADEEDHDEENQLEEHCYHKNSLSKEQLEAVVAELQKKVKVLQQRHRRHLEKLLGLENTVSQLRQNNLLNEERLQLLERVCTQTSAAVSDAGETVAIIYEGDNAAYLYTPLNDLI